MVCGKGRRSRSSRRRLGMTRKHAVPAGLRGRRFNGTLPVMKALVILAFFLAATAFAQTSQKRPFTFEDMMALKRVGAPVPSPDGKWVLFDCEDVDLEANTKTSHLWIVPASGGESRRFNPTPNHEERPRFSPDGQELAYTRNIDEVEATSTNNEIFIVPINGGAPQKISTSPGSDAPPLYSPDGKYLAWRSQGRAGFEADKWRAPA